MSTYAHASHLAQTKWGITPFSEAPAPRAQVSYDGRTWEDLGEHAHEHREDAAGDHARGQIRDSKEASR